jgi:hypothetical protein
LLQQSWAWLRFPPHRKWFPAPGGLSTFCFTMPREKTPPTRCSDGNKCQAERLYFHSSVTPAERQRLFDLIPRAALETMAYLTPSYAVAWHMDKRDGHPCNHVRVNCLLPEGCGVADFAMRRVIKLNHSWRCMLVYSVPLLCTYVCGVWKSGHDRHEARVYAAMTKTCAVDLAALFPV